MSTDHRQGLSAVQAPTRTSSAGAREVLLTVAGTIPSDIVRAAQAGEKPRADYIEMAEQCAADLVDTESAARAAGPLSRAIGRLGGAEAQLAVQAFTMRSRYRAVVTDSEGVGLLYAAFCQLTRRPPRHVMIGHRLSPAKKMWLHRLLGLRRRIDHVVVYSSAQRDVAIDGLGYRPDQVTLMPFMVDTKFWRPEGLAVPRRDRPMICSAGREFRDYTTLVDAVRGLDVDVVLAAASPWSRRQDTTADLDLPPNVQLTSLGHFELRQLYAESSLVVVPIVETDFQAGITTILEAMSMSRAVICTRTAGQRDTVIDETTGVYVPPGDPSALREAIVRLLDDPARSASLAEAGQQWVRQHADIDVYAKRFADLSKSGQASVSSNRHDPRVGFALEQTLGHITHSANLHRLVPSIEGIDPAFVDVEFAVDGVAARMPGFGNWTIRAGLRARRGIRRLGHLDALFIHTQVPALLCVGVMKRVPTIVSLDATPLQYDDLGLHYGHETSNHRIEAIKWRLNRRCFMTAAALVTWSEWTKSDLVERYHVPADRIHVVPPGVDVDRWTSDGIVGDRPADDGAVRALFVGGDFERKGGPTLVDAVRRLRAAGSPIEVDLVTAHVVDPEPGIRSHQGLTPNSPALIDLYHRADIFCLPTLGDCLPMVLCEAATVGLPLVSTDVGAISEVVMNGRTGRLVPAGDAEALAEALGQLVENPDERRRLGTEARDLVQREFSAAGSARQLVELLAGVVQHSR